MIRFSLLIGFVIITTACGGSDQPNASGNDDSGKDTVTGDPDVMAHYWLDTETGDIVVHRTKELPPIKLPNGHEAVRAIKWECSGRGQKKGPFVAFYRKFAPAFKEAVANNKFGQSKDVLISIDGKVWISKRADEARALMKKIGEPCRSIGSSSEVFPPSE